MLTVVLADFHMDSSVYESTVFAVMSDGTVLNSETPAIVHFSMNETCNVIIEQLKGMQMFQPEKHVLLFNGEVLSSNHPINKLKIDEASFFLVKEDKSAENSVTIRMSPRELYPLTSLEKWLLR